MQNSILNIPPVVLEKLAKETTKYNWDVEGKEVIINNNNYDYL